MVEVSAPLGELADHLWDEHRSRPCQRCALTTLTDAAIALSRYSDRPQAVIAMCRHLEVPGVPRVACHGDRALDSLAHRHALPHATGPTGRVALSVVIAGELSRALLNRYAVTSRTRPLRQAELTASFRQWCHQSAQSIALPALYVSHEGAYVALQSIDGVVAPLRVNRPTAHPPAASTSP